MKTCKCGVLVQDNAEMCKMCAKKKTQKANSDRARLKRQEAKVAREA